MKQLIFCLLLLLCIVPSTAQNDSIVPSHDFIKKPGAAALEVFSINFIINRYDAWIFRGGGEYWAKVSPSSWNENLKSGLQWDWNSFSTNWFGHPYHGSMNYNSARSLGLNYWESSPYSFLGSLTWEYFAETHPPSGNDLMTTTFGGIFLGETTHRLSKRLWDHPGHGFGKVWRAALATLINPMQAFNRWVYGQPKSKPSNNLKDLRSHIAFGDNFQVSSFNLKKKGGGIFFEFEMIYGNPHKSKSFYQPFEFFELTSWIRLVKKENNSSPFLNITSHGILWGKNLWHGEDHTLLMGAFQHFDYLHDEVIEIGSLGFTGGLVFNLSLNHNWELYYQLHTGFSALGGSNNEIVDQFTDDPESERDYILGPGILLKSEIVAEHERAGRLRLNYKHFTFYVKSGPDGVEKLNLFSARYTFPIWRHHHLGVDYTRYSRRVKYNEYIEYQNFHKDLNELRAFITFEF